MKRALIVGGAACVFEDAKSAQALADKAGVAFDLVIAVNDIGKVWPKITHWVTLHPEYMGAFQRERRLNGLNDDYLTIAIKRRFNTTIVPRIDRDSDDWKGSSGLFAVKIAREERCTHIVLAGVPMTPTPHYLRGARWHPCETYRQGWRDNRVLIEKRTRSMSGWTRELLGAPTAEWLLGD